MKPKIMIAFIAILSFVTFSVSAQKPNLHGENQRIRQGVKSGELTRLEAARLQSEKNNLKREAIRYKRNDGHISRKERADLRRDNRRLSRQIFRQKHDRQRRH
ncbi:MAG: hypothetical protein ABIN67_22665 [Ferruginibacter sp.]